MKKLLFLLSMILIIEQSILKAGFRNTKNFISPAYAALGANQFLQYNSLESIKEPISIAPQQTNTTTTTQIQSPQTYYTQTRTNSTPSWFKKAQEQADKMLNPLFTEDDDIAGLNFDDLRTNTQQARFIKDDFEKRNIKVSSEFNFTLVAYYIQYFLKNPYNQEKYNTFIEKIIMYARKNKSAVITMEHVDYAFADVTANNIYNMSKYILNINFGITQNFYIADNIVSLAENIQYLKRFINPQEYKLSVYHESAHTLVTMLMPINFKLTHVSAKPSGFTGGLMGVLPTNMQSNNYVSLQEKLIEKKRHIMALLAGSIAEEFIHNEQLPFQEWVDSKKYSGKGDIYLLGSDMFKAFGNTQEYCELKNSAPLQSELEDMGLIENNYIPYSNLNKQAWGVLEEYYYETMQFLIENKELLDKIAQHIIDNGGIASGHKLREITEISRQKYDIELTPTEQIAQSIASWILYTFDRVKAYEQYAY